MVFRSTKCDCWGRQAGLLSGTPYTKAMLPSCSSDIRNCAPIRDRSGRRAWEESRQPLKCQLRADSASLASTLITDGANLHSTSFLPLRAHWKFKLYVFRAHKDVFFFFFTLSSLFPKELKEQIPLPTQNKRTPRRISGSRGRAGQKNNAGGVTSPSAFSSVPRKGLSWGARWCWGAMAGGPWQNCSFSWAGARCKEGCCSSWCTPSSVSLGSRRIGTQPRRWGRLLTMHTTCGTWFLQHRPKGVRLGQRTAAPWAQSPGTALPYSSHSPEPWWVQENTQGGFLEHPKSTTYAVKKTGLISLAFDNFSQGYLRCQYQWIKSCYYQSSFLFKVGIHTVY